MLVARFGRLLRVAVVAVMFAKGFLHRLIENGTSVETFFLSFKVEHAQHDRLLHGGQDEGGDDQVQEQQILEGRRNKGPSRHQIGLPLLPTRPRR